MADPLTDAHGTRPMQGEPENLRALPWQMLGHNDPQIRQLAAMALSRDAALRALRESDDRVVVVAALFSPRDGDLSMMCTAPHASDGEIGTLAGKMVAAFSAALAQARRATQDGEVPDAG